MAEVAVRSAGGDLSQEQQAGDSAEPAAGLPDVGGTPAAAPEVGAGGLEVRHVAACGPEVVETLAAWHFTEFGGRPQEVRLMELRAVAAQGAPPPFRVPSCLAAFRDGELVGSVRLSEDDFDGVRPNYTPWLASLYVHPSCRRQGLGARLVRACEEAAASAGFSSLYLWAVSDSAEQFYVRLGWSVVERTGAPHDFGAGFRAGHEVPILRRSCGADGSLASEAAAVA